VKCLALRLDEQTLARITRSVLGICRTNVLRYSVYKTILLPEPCVHFAGQSGVNLKLALALARLI